MTTKKKSTVAAAHQLEVPIGYRDDATARDHASSCFSKLTSLQLLFDQHRSSLRPFAVLQRKQSQDVRRSSFQFRDQLLRSATKESVKHHRWNADGKARATPGNRVYAKARRP